jgi:hypothetical protein
MDFIDHRSTANFIFGLSATDEKVRITSDGDVGIGVSNPSTKLEVDGTVTADEVDLSTKAVIEGVTPRIELFESDTTDLNTRIRNSTGDFQIQTINDAGTTSKVRLVVDHATGDISFREDSGSNAKFYWDASAESLGIGTTPTQALDVVGDIQTSGGIYVGGSAAANKLDDYEEGTWTPVIADATSGGNTGTAATLDGAYTKVGRQVTVTFRALNIDTTGMTSSNNLVVRGLPFTSGSGVTGSSEGNVRLDLVDLNDSACNVTCTVGSAGSVITFRQTVDNGNDAQIAVSSYSSGTADILGTITYFTS